MTRTCWANGPTKLFGITVTIGFVTYFDSRFSTSRASIVGVWPTATISSTSGIEIRPSGRTGAAIDNSGLRQTKISSESPGPIWYSAVGVGDPGGEIGRAH